MILLNDNKISEVICLYCYKRWISARPVETKLVLLECPQCHKQGFAIETGETSTAQDLIEKARDEHDG